MILILDYGSQFTQLIARRIREFGVKATILPHFRMNELEPKSTPWKECRGVILSGGPQSVEAKDSPSFSDQLLTSGKPILGICYGFQLINKLLGGVVSPSETREYGFEVVKAHHPGPLLLTAGLSQAQVWMSHGDAVELLAPSLQAESYSRNGHLSSFFHKTLPIYGFQFHPEVEHAEHGKELLKAFVFNVCQCELNWNMTSQVENMVESVRTQTNSHSSDCQVICALSGGVDSAVAAVLVSQAIGSRLHCFFVDNGLLREGEAEEVMERLTREFSLNIIRLNCRDVFLSRLQGVTDPEQKRKIIGATFIEMFERAAKTIPNARYLVQGTLYTDVIESVPLHGSSVVIKSHHNVGGLPERLGFELVEPLRELFKDEVRELGRALEIPAETLNRHPFPGPGLAIRILGEVTPERLSILRKADRIFIEELKKQNLYDSVWQAFVVLLPVSTVGVMGDQRTYEHVVSLRAVQAGDGMTADWSRLPYDFLAHVSSRIVNEVKGINRVVFDISSKPPATIEWE